MESLARTYANALFLLSIEEDNAKEMLDEVNELHLITSTNDDLVKLLDSKALSKEEKKSIVEKIFKDKINKSLFNFINLLIDKSRSHYLKDICIEYRKLYLAHFGIKEAKIYSTIELTDEKMKDLKDTLEKKYNSEFIVRNIIDQELIAGIKIVIGDLVLDGSIQNKLAKLENSISI